jgi:hypothetical protein
LNFFDSYLIATSLPFPALREVHTRLIVLNERARQQGLGLRVTSFELVRGDASLPGLLLSSRAVRFALTVLENLDLIERFHGKCSRDRQTIILRELDPEDIGVLCDGLKAIAESHLSKDFQEQVRIARATDEFWKAVSSVLKDAGISADTFFSRHFQPEETLFGRGTPVPRQAQEDPPLPDGGRGTGVPRQARRGTPVPAKQSHCLSSKSCLVGEEATCVASDSDEETDVSNLRRGRKRPSLEEKDAAAKEKTARLMAGQPVELGSGSIGGKNRAQVTTEPIPTGIDPSKKRRRKKSTQGIRMAEWLIWPELLPMLEQIFDPEYYPRPLLVEDESGQIIPEGCNAGVWRLIGLLFYGYRRKGVTWTRPKDGNFSVVTLRAYSNFLHLMGETAHDGSAAELEYLVKRVSPTDRERVPLADVPKILAGFAFRQVDAIKNKPQYMVERGNLKDIFGPHDRRRNLSAWRKATLHQGLEDDPVAFVEGLPFGAITQAKPVDLPDVGHVEEKDDSFTLSVDDA